jgi:hypothetical protein
METHLTDKLISGYLDGLLTEEETRLARRHMAECSGCAERLAKFNLLEETLAEMDPQSVEDAALYQVRTRVLREVAREERVTRRVFTPWWLRLFSTQTLAYATVALLLTTSVVWFTGDQPEPAGPKGEPSKLAQLPILDEDTLPAAASAAQQEFYQKATDFLASNAKSVFNSASEGAKSLRDESQSVLVGRVSQITEKSFGLLASAGTSALEFTEAAAEPGARAYDAAAKQALPQAGIAAGTTLLHLLGA